MEPRLQKVSFLVCIPQEEKPTILNGKVAVTMVSGVKYDGDWVNGEMHGHGLVTFPDGVTYEGDLFHNCITGFGVYTWPSGARYEGQVLNGLRHGSGVMSFTHSPVVYTGQWDMGLRHGIGTLTLNAAKTAYYEGEWVHDQKRGQGKMVYESGDVYEGEWQCDVRSGQGVMTWNTLEQEYSGEWRDNLANGIGLHIWFRRMGDFGLANHALILMYNRYHGYFKDGLRDGFGILYYATGARYEGYWVADKKRGRGAYVFDDGHEWCGNFENDRPAMAPGEVFAPALSSVSIRIDDLLEEEENAAATFKAVTNVLMCYNSELRNLYDKYCKRNSLLLDPNARRPSFTILVGQLWEMMRDVRLITSLTSLARLSHIAAFARRPTERLAAMRVAAAASAAQEAAEKAMELAALGNTAHTGTPAECLPTRDLPSQPSKNTSYSGVNPFMLSAPQSMRDASISGAVATTKSFMRQDSLVSQPAPPYMTNIPEDEEAYEPFPAPEPTGWLNPQASAYWEALLSEGGLVPLHSPNGELLFREFCEVIVRVAALRYRHLPGLERRVHTTVTQHLAPMAGVAASRKSMPPSRPPLDEDISGSKEVQELLQQALEPLTALFLSISSPAPLPQNPNLPPPQVPAPTGEPATSMDNQETTVRRVLARLVKLGVVGPGTKLSVGVAAVALCHNFMTANANTQRLKITGEGEAGVDLDLYEEPNEDDIREASCWLDSTYIFADLLEGMLRLADKAVPPPPPEPELPPALRMRLSDLEAMMPEVTQSQRVREAQVPLRDEEVAQVMEPVAMSLRPYAPLGPRLHEFFNGETGLLKKLAAEAAAANAPSELVAIEESEEPLPHE